MGHHHRHRIDKRIAGTAGFIAFYDVKAGKVLYQDSAPMHVHGLVMNEASDKLFAAGHNKLVEWSHLMVINRNLNLDPNPTEAIGYLEGLPVTRKSAVLTEKLADLYWAKRKLSDALDTYAEALKLDPLGLLDVELRPRRHGRNGAAKKKEPGGCGQPGFRVFHEGPGNGVLIVPYGCWSTRSSPPGS